jgi:hypothetical protein
VARLPGQLSFVEFHNSSPCFLFVRVFSDARPSPLLVSGRSWNAGLGSDTVPSTALTPTSTGTGGSTRLWTPSLMPSGHLTGG